MILTNSDLQIGNGNTDNQKRTNERKIKQICEPRSLVTIVTIVVNNYQYRELTNQMMNALNVAERSRQGLSA